MLRKILKFKLQLAVILILGVILIQLITAYVFGFKAEEQLNLQFKQMTSSPFIKVSNRTYHKGFFSSDATTELVLNNKILANLIKVLPNVNESAVLSSTYSIKYSTHIVHGLFAGVLNGYFSPTVAVETTTIYYPEAIKKMLDKFFVKKDPMTLTNIIYLDKSGQMYITSPAFDYEEALSGVKVVWGGLKLNIKYNKSFDKFANTLKIPQFSLIAPTKANVAINGVNYASTSGYSNNKLKVGKTTLNIDTLKIALLDKTNLNLKLGDLLNSLTGISATEFLNQVNVINPSDFTLNKLSYASTSEDKNNYFNALARVKFESLETESAVYGPLNLNVSVDHVLANEFSQLVDNVAKISAESDIATDKGQQMFINTLKTYFGPILVDRPIIRLNDFMLKTPSGLVHLSGEFSTKDFEITDMNDNQSFMKKLDVNVSFSVPKPILSYLLMLQMEYYLSAGNAEMDKQSATALKKVVNILLDNQISAWKKKGYIKETNGILSSNLIYTDGHVTLKPK